MTAIEALQPAIIYIGAGLAAAFASRAVRLSPIVGYLVAGLLIGPSGFSLLEKSETTRFLAELGVVFLLFEIGLRFSLHEIRTRRTDILQLAPLQMLLCGLAFTGAGLALGFAPIIAGIVGASLALSSTLVVSGVLSDRPAPTGPAGPTGRSASAVLIAQHIAAVFILVAATSANAGPDDIGREMLIALGMATLALIAALIAGRLIVRPLFRFLAATGNREAFTVVALFIVMIAGAATARLELSLALGAFLAGMAISDTPCRQVIQSDMKPFRELLPGLFFISVGMSVNLPALAAIWPAILLTALVIMILKTALIFIVARLNGRALPGAMQLGFLLGQGSEFTLVVLGAPAIMFGLPGDWTGILIAAVAVTLIAAPIWTALGLHIAQMLAEHARRNPAARVEPGDAAPVIILGMTAEGRLCADALRDHHIAYVALDNDPARFVAAASDGYRIVHGDPRDVRLMQSLGVENARAIVVASSGFAALPDTLTADGPLRFVVAETPDDRVRQTAMGYRSQISHAEPRGIELAADLLSALNVDPSRVAQWLTDQNERCGLAAELTRQPEIA